MGVSASAPAKLILCGEHAVVYGRPAIALPLEGVRAVASVEPAPAGMELQILAPDLGAAWFVSGLPDHPLSELTMATLRYLDLGQPQLTITLRAQIPVASGMGSGAAIATALVRALASYAGRTLTPAEQANLVYGSERRFHGTPSGIDSTVVAYERAIWFQRRDPAPLIEPITIGQPLRLLVGDTGVRSATHLPVGAVRKKWQANPARYEAIFDAIGALALQVRAALAAGAAPELGMLLNENQRLLVELGVSSPELARLIAAANGAGALGAKLSGAGWGGVMLALVTAERAPDVATALRAAGAVRLLETMTPA